MGCFHILIYTVVQTFSKNSERAKRWHGLRQDSGDPLAFAPKAKEVYEKMGINPREKMIIYSDALNLDKALKLKEQADEIGFKGIKFMGCLNTF